MQLPAAKMQIKLDHIAGYRYSYKPIAPGYSDGLVRKTLWVHNSIERDYW